jgi:nanoRNase/pAp phosphatase (c-di-AMP/oligoRNAs hydrolase)
VRAASVLAEEPAVFAVHRHADADAIASAASLAIAFGGWVWAPAGVAAVGVRIAASLDVPIATVPDAFAAEGAADKAARARGRQRQRGGARAPASPLIVLVDCSTWSQVGDAAAERIRAGPYAVIDHHPYGDDFEGARFVVRDSTRPATAEIAAGILDAAQKNPPPKVRIALLAGMLADSGGFTRGDARTLGAASRLLVRGSRLEEAGSLLAEPAHGDRSMRIARLKAARRARLFEVGGRLVATSKVAAYDADAAMGLVELGADCAIVAAPTEEGARLTARAGRDVPVKLGAILNALARAEPVAAGGGHDRSAGFRAPGDPDAWLSRAFESLSGALGGEARELVP